MNPSPLTRRDAPPTAELRGVLTGLLRTRAGRGRTVLEVARRPLPYYSTFQLEELDLRLDDGGALKVVFKDVSPGAVHDEARGVRPEFVTDPEREIAVYRTVLPSAGLGTPECFGAVVDRRRGRYWLFLEHVPGVPLWQIAMPDVWRDVARWLATLHVRLQPAAARPGPWLRYDERLYRRLIRRAVRFATAARPGREDTARWLADRYTRLIPRLAGLPPTFIHGEFYPSNVLVQMGRGARRVRVVDWETAAVGPALMDLAALTSGRWTDDERAGLVDAYRGAVAALLGTAPDRNELTRVLGWCRLHQAVQWLGWSPAWQPPPDHAFDWFSEALVLAEHVEP